MTSLLLCDELCYCFVNIQWPAPPSLARLGLGSIYPAIELEFALFFPTWDKLRGEKQRRTRAGKTERAAHRAVTPSPGR
jgi:hypothetical protein